jgi:hypothetical protein
MNNLDQYSMIKESFIFYFELKFIQLFTVFKSFKEWSGH